MFGIDRRKLNELKEEERLKIMYNIGMITAKDAKIDLAISHKTIVR